MNIDIDMICSMYEYDYRNTHTTYYYHVVVGILFFLCFFLSYTYEIDLEIRLLTGDRR